MFFRLISRETLPYGRGSEINVQLMLTKEEAQRLTEKILTYSKLPECMVNLSNSEDVFIRFANNGITTSGYRIDQSVSISATTEDKRSGSATVNEFSDEALRRGVEQAESLASISQPSPEDMPALGPQKYPSLDNFDSPTAASRGDGLIGHVKALIDGGKGNKLIAAGFVQRSAATMSVGNKKGLFGYHRITDSGLTATMRNAAGTSSGWATQVSTSIRDLNGEEAARISNREVSPGRRQAAPGARQIHGNP
jgi:predicted Zn-dependent protease